MVRASPSLLIYVIALLLLLPITYSCPLLQRRLCGAANATAAPASGQCGDHVVRCSGSAAQIQFYGEEQWCTIKGFSYDDRVLVVQDPGVNSRLVHHDCGLMYSFPPRAPPPLPRPVPFQNSLLSGFFLFNCDVGEFNFSRDVFVGAYNSTGCTGFDLHYSYEYEGQGAPANCTGGANMFEWRLRFDESGRNLSVLSAGFSHQRTLRPDCFDCRMLGADCSPAGVGNATACSCAKTCSVSFIVNSLGKHIRIRFGVSLVPHFEKLTESRGESYLGNRTPVNSVHSKEDISRFKENFLRFSSNR